MEGVLPPMTPLMCEIYLLDTNHRYVSRETSLNQVYSTLTKLAVAEPPELDYSLRFFRCG